MALGVATIVQVNVDLWQRGWELYQDRVDKGLGLIDCISFMVIEDHGVHRAFTYDRHFEQAGYIRLLK